MANLIKQENDAIRSFFQAPKKKKPKTIATATKKAEEGLQLAVSADEPTPFVKQLEDSGAGHVVNSRTGATKKVTRGKHATKGRGVIGDQVVPSAPLPKKVFAQLNTATSHEEEEEDDDDDALLNESSGRVDNVADEDEDEDDPGVLVQKQADNEVQFKKDEDGILEAHPVYCNEMWAESSVRKMTKLKHRRHVNYHRREQGPTEFQLKEAETVECVVQKLTVTENGTPEVNDVQVIQVIESWAKLLTFHPDGTFIWPESSKHLCWNCSHSFSGPPAMIPRSFNRVFKYYQVYGNFCTWSCAKRYAFEQTDNEYYSPSSPSLDFFAWKYFGVRLPLPMAPSPILLDSFSEFGMSIEDYRKVGHVNFRDTAACNYTIVQPPCVPYEVLVTWEKQRPQKVKIKTGYEKSKKRMFEERMAGTQPMPDMPKGIAEDTRTISDVRPGQLVPSKKKKKKNLLNLLE